METLQNIFNFSPYFPILITLVLGFLVGKISVGRFSLGSIVGTLLVGMLVGLNGVEITPSVRWVFFGFFMYVVGYQGGYHLISTLKLRKKSILLASVLMSLVAVSTLAIASWLFELDLYMAIGMTAGSFVHPEIISAAIDAIGDFSGVSEAAKNLAQSEIILGYMLTVIFGVLGPVIMMSWFFPKVMPKVMGFQTESSDLLDATPSAMRKPINSAHSIVRRVFEVNQESTVVGKTLQQLTAPSIDIIFELSRASNSDQGLKDGDPIAIGDIITITGRHNALFYFDDNLLGTELPCDSQTNVSEESYLMQVNTPELVGLSLQQVKTALNQSTHRGVCITELLRDEQALEITPDLVVKRHDILQITGSSCDVQLVKNDFSQRSPNSGVNQALFGAGLVLAYMISMWHLNIGGIYLYFSMGLSSLVSGIAVGWACHKINPLDMLPVDTSNAVRNVSLLVFTAITGLYFGPKMLYAMNASGIKVALVGSAVVLISQLLSFAIAYRIFRIKSPSDLIGCVSGSQHSGLGMPAIYKQDGFKSTIHALAVSYITSSFLMLIVVSMVLNLM
ncbi:MULTISPECIES: hypothetical protein [Shewanella]|uniref:YidE/YbjL duplication domain-containing protein n=1 Tax=Shewanella marisflavi TaxID=260364 RepID=A0ABX5WWD4_9GAMM|nr:MULTISPECIES: hypothetical protein [Shewanella]QDF76824.1 hypothetical protein FGA12_17570 [Shewanella marisflavi]